MDGSSESQAPHTVHAGLPAIAERREVQIAGIRLAGRRRRPSGERAPLQRELTTVGRISLVAGITTFVLWASLFMFPATTEWWSRVDTDILEWFVDQRVDWLTSLADGFSVIGSSWFTRLLRIGTIVALVFVRRWRHFFAVLLAILLVQITTDVIREFVGRPRPLVEIIGAWSGPSHPSASVAALGVTLATMAYSLVPKGSARRRAMVTTLVILAAYGLTRLYLGTDHLSDVLVAAVFSVAVTIVLFRWFAPERAFPVIWNRGVKAHLDVTGERGDAIRKAVADQLDLDVIDIEPFGLAGSGGSTPLRLRLAHDEHPYVFAKLYSQTHLRSDRWYKVARTILYGSLEDEVRFISVRHLVEYEDYIQRLMRDADVPCAEPFGIVELAPEREYLMVSEFLEGSVELTDAEVDDTIIDAALGIIRRLWDAGLAHRDIKPANVMLNDGKVVLIDVAFGTVRPSPWRQAVDLANMMVILALRSSASHVYERALLQFSPEDIAEAFAATRSVTLPSQSRSSLALLEKEQGIDIVAEFQRLSPEREPISIQRWSPRRIFFTLGAVVVFGFILIQVINEIQGRGVL
jgi:tRNA A-37 threonylcarbamoyl transferase component Bud32/membrane-associated phospholipid phosphatase